MGCRRRGRIAAALAWAALACIAVVVPQAGAQVAIGPPLAQPPGTAEGCELGILPPLRQTVPIPPSCTLLGADISGRWTSQVPRGEWTVTQATVRTGPRVGPMRIAILQALRSQAVPPGGQPAGIICCTSPVQSQVFTPPPNSTVTVPVSLPVRNTVTSIDGEPVEVVDYLGISVLTLGSSLPLAADGAATTTLFYPAIPPGGQQLAGPSVPGAFPLVSAVVCPRAAGTALDVQSAHQVVGCAVVPAPGAPPPGPGGASMPAVPSALREIGVVGAPRRLSVPVVCGAGTGRCRGTVQALTTRRSFDLAPGASGAVALTLPAQVRRRLARGARVPLTLTLRPEGGPAARTRVVLRPLPRTVRATGGGAVRLLVEMPPQVAAARRTKVELRLGRVVAGRATVRTRPGRVIVATVRLTPAARQRLQRAGRLGVRVRAVHIDGAGAQVVRARPLTVRAPGR
ncbi:MAG: hypothetical protein AB7V62_03650 [Thermoleophilia bacterium]